MGKFDWLKQISDGGKVLFLVDEIGPLENAGITKAPEKIDYNCKLLGDEFNLGAEIHLALARSEGVSTVFPVGRYIVLLTIPKVGKGGIMVFTDHSIAGDEEDLRKGALKSFSPSLADQWLKVRGQMRISYSPIEDDLIRLVKIPQPDEL